MIFFEKPHSVEAGSQESIDVTSSPESTGMCDYPDPGINPSNQLRRVHQAAITSAEKI